MAKKKPATETKTADKVETNEADKSEDVVQATDTDAVEKNAPAEKVTEPKAVDTKTAESKPAEDNDFVKRMEDEAEELNEKTVKLNTFIHDNPKYKDLGRMEQALIYGQLKAMQTYLHMLNQRIKVAKSK